MVWQFAIQSSLSICMLSIEACCETLAMPYEQSSTSAICAARISGTPTWNFLCIVL